MGVIAWIIIGLVAGWLATQILGGRGGLLYNLAVGFCSKSFVWRSCRISGAT
jgi:uncharacterized membrane protein YeaQ/YmgE (transglycosylase-associated protein family)